MIPSSEALQNTSGESGAVAIRFILARAQLHIAIVSFVTTSIPVTRKSPAPVTIVLSPVLGKN